MVESKKTVSPSWINVRSWGAGAGVRQRVTDAVNTHNSHHSFTHTHRKQKKSPVQCYPPCGKLLQLSGRLYR